MFKCNGFLSCGSSQSPHCIPCTVNGQERGRDQGCPFFLLVILKSSTEPSWERALPGGFLGEHGLRQLQSLPRHQGTEAWASSRPPACHTALHPPRQAFTSPVISRGLLSCCLSYLQPGRRHPHVPNRPAAPWRPRVESPGLGGKRGGWCRRVLWPVWARWAASARPAPMLLLAREGIPGSPRSTGPLGPRALTWKPHITSKES